MIKSACRTSDPTPVGITRLGPKTNHFTYLYVYNSTLNTHFSTSRMLNEMFSFNPLCACAGKCLLTVRCISPPSSQARLIVTTRVFTSAWLPREVWAPSYPERPDFVCLVSLIWRNKMKKHTWYDIFYLLLLIDFKQTRSMSLANIVISTLDIEVFDSKESQCEILIASDRLVWD